VIFANAKDLRVRRGAVGACQGDRRPRLALQLQSNVINEGPP
jgi:hypothetical protein